MILAIILVVTSAVLGTFIRDSEKSIKVKESSKTKSYNQHDGKGRECIWG